MTDSRILSAINKPGRYLGHEFNSIKKDWDSVKAKVAFIFPDLYEIGMSHQGLQILYHLLNKKDEFLAERCYCPDTDVEKLLRKEDVSLTSLESGRPLKDFDILGFTLPYELCYTNILTVLDLASIPFYTNQRDDSYPILLAGGACALNPEPVADFFDAILLGDGEEAMIEITQLIAETKQAKASKEDVLNQLAEIEGVYVPSHFHIEYDETIPETPIAAIKHKSNKPTTVLRRIVANLDDIDHLKNPIVPNAKIVHDRLAIEVARGCTRGCRFCQAGITYRPVRERSAESIMELAKESIENSGFDELALLSLSTGDYSCLEQVLTPLMDEFADKYVSVAMPSMRVGTLTPSIMEQVKRVRKSGFTLAPEAGTERLRNVINKGITEEALIDTCTEAFNLGWRVIKCYFMIGLPTENQADMDGIVDLVIKMLATRGHGPGKGKKQINVSVGTFVPKPHTPFQWEKQLTIDESMSNIRRISDNLPKKGANLRYHNPRTSYLEGVFSRGDRRLAGLLENAWQNGARLDGWTEHFNIDVWQLAAQNCGLSLDNYLRARELDEILPWEHLQSRVDTQFLKDELKKGKAEGYTPDCRYNDCQKCGLCDFDTIMPIVHNRKGDLAPPERKQITPVDHSDDGHFKYIVHYSRTGNICYLGHLEILQVIFRALQRAHIPTNYSQGFNPSPKVSFGPALPVGTESYGEYFIMDLKSPLQSVNATKDILTQTLAPGLEVTGIELHSGKVPQKMMVSYSIHLPTEASENWKEAAESFYAAESFVVEKTRKGKTKEIDIRPMIEKFAFTSSQDIDLDVIAESAQAGIKPIEAVTHILQLTQEEVNLTKIVKKGWIQLG
ncbi:MAG: radical SAM family uncharacterized protein/radical SAM-linked protein [Desulforhopalus sp.]|jgi:radical SAM family uncharacterized protein/radical SAM-linked protein